MNRCANCGEAPRYHVAKKCLFAATKYAQPRCIFCKAEIPERIGEADCHIYKHPRRPPRRFFFHRTCVNERWGALRGRQEMEEFNKFLAKNGPSLPSTPVVIK